MISSGERDWRDYYKTWNNNMPHQYHNGGIWPWVGGLYVATLVYADRKKQAQTELAMLAAALQAKKNGNATSTSTASQARPWA